MLFAIIGFLFYQVIGWTMWFLQDHVWLRTGQCTDSVCSCFNSTLFFILLIFSCIRHHPRLPTHLIFSIHFSALLEICGSVKHGVERVAVCMCVCVRGGGGCISPCRLFKKGSYSFSTSTRMFMKAEWWFYSKEEKIERKLCWQMCSEISRHYCNGIQGKVKAVEKKYVLFYFANLNSLCVVCVLCRFDSKHTGRLQPVCFECHNSGLCRCRALCSCGL